MVILAVSIAVSVVSQVLFRWFRWFRSGVSMVSAVPVVSFRWFLFGVSGFSTCHKSPVSCHHLTVFVSLKLHDTSILVNNMHGIIFVNLK